MNGGPARRGPPLAAEARTVDSHTQLWLNPQWLQAPRPAQLRAPLRARAQAPRAQAPLGTHRRRITRTDSRPARAGSGSMRIGSGSTDPASGSASTGSSSRSASSPRRLGRWHRDACGCIRDRASRARHRRDKSTTTSPRPQRRESSRNSTSTTNVIAHRTVPTATVRTPSTSTGRTAGGPKPCRRRRGMVMRLAVARRPLRGKTRFERISPYRPAY